MKNIFNFILGVLIIIFSNTIFNFFKFSPKIDFTLIYIIILSLYWEQDDYALYIISALLGYFVDVSVGMYQGQCTILFLSISIVGVLIKDKIRKDYFIVTFFISSLIIVVSAIYNTIISSININKGFAHMFVVNVFYIIFNVIALAVIIGIVNMSVNYWRNNK